MIANHPNPMALVFPFILILCLYWQSKSSARKLLSEGRRVQAKVTARPLIAGFDYGATPSLTYEFTDALGQTYTKTIDLFRVPPSLQMMKVGDLITVIYAPDKSSRNLPEDMLQRQAEGQWKGFTLFLLAGFLLGALKILFARN